MNNARLMSEVSERDPFVGGDKNKIGVGWNKLLDSVLKMHLTYKNRELLPSMQLGKRPKSTFFRTHMYLASLALTPEGERHE